MKSQLLKREDIANGTMAFYFRKPQGFSFKAGQSIDITLVNPSETDEEGNTRSFSIASAPNESFIVHPQNHTRKAVDEVDSPPVAGTTTYVGEQEDLPAGRQVPHSLARGEFIMIATRTRDTAFKRVLKNMLLETEVELEGPFGSFSLHTDSSKPAVFLAGGIGITPFRSMVLDATYNQSPHRIYLFYSNRTPKDAAFTEELDMIQKKNTKFTLIQTMTGLDDDTSWSGERGYIDSELLKKYIGDLVNPIFYMAGPTKMISSLKEMLLGAEVNGENIRFEEMTGY